ncbi:glucosamine-6-phosphate deaminase, partial [Lacticaseibacillus rhamnosus]
GPRNTLSARNPIDPLAQRERIRVRVYPHSTHANKAVAGQIADLIRERAAAGRNCVLGLATGSTPVGVYDELVRLHREESR